MDCEPTSDNPADGHDFDRSNLLDRKVRKGTSSDMDLFPGMRYQIDAETLRALYRLSNRLGEGGVMTRDECREFAQRVKVLLRKSEKVE